MGMSENQVDREHQKFKELSCGGTAVRTDNNDFFTEVAKGEIPGHSLITAFGERESIGTTATGEDVWRGNELTPAPTSTTSIPIPADVGEQMTVVSESVNDDSVGSGVKTIEIDYLDATGAEQTETIIMDGTTPVDTVATDIRFVQEIHTLTGSVAAGHIKIYKKGTAGLVYNMIALGGNQSIVPNRMVPFGKYLILNHWHAEEAQGKRCVIRIRSTDKHGVLLPGIFIFKDSMYLKQTASGEVTLNNKIPALSIIKVTAWADQAGAEVGASWSGTLVDDGI